MLQTEVSLYVYEERYLKVKYFKQKSISFIRWI